MKKCQGGELNSRPTPNAFGAALPLEMINGELGIFLCFQDALQLASLRQCFRLFLGNNFEFLAEAFGCCRVGPADVARNALPEQQPSQCSGRPDDPFRTYTQGMVLIPGGRIELPTKGL